MTCGESIREGPSLAKDPARGGFDHQGAYEHPATHGATFFAIANPMKKL